MRRESGQAAVETAIMLPLVMIIMFGAFQLGRVYYIYNTLEKSVRGGMQYLVRSEGVNFCDPADPAIIDAKNFIVFGNLQGTGTPVVTGLTTDMIQILPERADSAGVAVTDCPCTGDGSCDLLSGGRAPDYITVNMGSGFPLVLSFPLMNFGTLNLRVSVRQPFLGA